MNGEGGNLFIGVCDDSNIKGINNEYKLNNPKKCNWDGYFLFLVELIERNLIVENSFQYFDIWKNFL